MSNPESVAQLCWAMRKQEESTTSTESSLADFTLRLRDGRLVGIASTGNDEGFPIFHCHGSGSSRLEVKLLAQIAARCNVRLIGLDRPGIGRSDANTGYTLLDWPDDLADVANQLGYDKFAVEGVSAGGPFALACAYKIPDRLASCGLISTASPDDLVRIAGPLWMRAVWWIGEHLPKLFRIYLRLTVSDSVPSEATVEKSLLRYSSMLGSADKETLSNIHVRGALSQALAEGRRIGGQASREAALMLLKPWNFHLDDVAHEKIFLWHGEEDRVMPIGPARLLAQAIPHCVATYYSHEGHFSLLVNHASEIFSRLKT